MAVSVGCMPDLLPWWKNRVRSTFHHVVFGLSCTLYIALSRRSGLLLSVLPRLD